MERWKPFVEIKTTSGKAVERGNMKVTPEAQALVVRLPYLGFVWNRPVAVIVEQDGRRERMPINNVTLTAVLAMAGAAAVISTAVLIAGWLGRE